MLGRLRWVGPRNFAPIVALAVLGLAASAAAADLDPEVTPLPVEIHGFVSQGFIKTTGSDYLVAESRKGSFELSEAGINFTTQLADNFRLGMQLFAYDLGTLGTYDVSADWYYLDYRLRDWLGFRAGRLKLPIGLYNDIADIDAARVSILLPTGLYPVTNRDLIPGQTGAEIYGFVPSRRLGALDYRLFGGSIAINIPSQIASTTGIGVPLVGGGRLMWETPIAGLRVGVTALALKIEATSTSTPAFTETGHVYIGVGSAEYAAHDLLLQAEFQQQRNQTTASSDTSLVPLGAVVSETGYGLAAYRVSRWLQPGLYYSFFYANRNLGDQSNALTTNDQNIQDDLAATLRFDVRNFWIIKLEGHFMHGTALLAGDGAAPVNWGMFLVRTTAYF
jgi:hypothetical protein